MRRRKGMMRRVPAVFFVVMFEHGKIGDPEQFEIACHVARALEGLVLISVLARQLQPYFAGCRVLRVLVCLVYFSSLLAHHDNRDYQIVHSRKALLTYLRNNLWPHLF